MPQASDELRSEMERRFGDPVDDTGPIDFLRRAGYTLTSRWEWKKQGVETLDDMSHDEYQCLRFLIEEWDYAGLATPTQEPSP